MGIVKNIMVRAVADFSALVTGARTAENAMRRLGAIRPVTGALEGAIGGITKKLSVLAATYISFDFLKDATSDAMKLDAMMQTLNTRLGTSQVAFQDWAETQGKALGLSRLQIAQYGNTYSNMLQDASKDQADLASKTETMLKVSAILRTKLGMQQEEVSQRIRSAMNSEADGADELGINVRVTAVEQSKAYKTMAGGVDTFSKLNAGMQKAIMYQYILDEVTRKYGMTLTDNAANRQAQFMASLNNLKTSLGSAFLPIWNAVLPALITFINWLDVGIRKVASFFAVLFGYKQVTNQANDATQAYQNQTSAVSGLSDANKKLDKSLQQNLASFDQINLLAEKTADTMAGAGAGVPVAGKPTVPSFIPPTPDLTQASKQVEAFKKAWEPIGKFFQGMWDPIVVYFKGKWLEFAIFWDSYGVQITRAWNKVWHPLFETVRFLFDELWIVIKYTFKAIWVLFKDFSDQLTLTTEGLILILTGAVQKDWGMMKEGVAKIDKAANINMVNDTMKVFGEMNQELSDNNKEHMTRIKNYMRDDFATGMTFVAKSWADFIEIGLTKPLNQFDGQFTKTMENWKAFGKTLQDTIKATTGVEIPKIGSQLFNLPKMANGGIVSSPTVAMIGEAGTEVVSPLSALKDLVASTVATAVATAVQMAGGNQQQKTQSVDLQLDGRTLARVLKPYMDQEDKRVGTNIRYAPTITTPPARFG